MKTSTEILNTLIRRVAYLSSRLSHDPADEERDNEIYIMIHELDHLIDWIEGVGEFNIGE